MTTASRNGDVFLAEVRCARRADRFVGPWHLTPQPREPLEKWFGSRRRAASSERRRFTLTLCMRARIPRMCGHRENYNASHSEDRGGGEGRGESEAKGVRERRERGGEERLSDVDVDVDDALQLFGPPRFTLPAEITSWSKVNVNETRIFSRASITLFSQWKNRKRSARERDDGKIWMTRAMIYRNRRRARTPLPDRYARTKP